MSDAAIDTAVLVVDGATDTGRASDVGPPIDVALDQTRALDVGADVEVFVDARAADSAANDSNGDDSPTTDAAAGDATADSSRDGAADGAVAQGLCPTPTAIAASGSVSRGYFDGDFGDSRLLASGLAVGGSRVAMNISNLGTANGGTGVSVANLACTDRGLDLLEGAGARFPWSLPAPLNPENVSGNDYGRSLAFLDDGLIIAGYAGAAVANVGSFVGELHFYRFDGGYYRRVGDLRSTEPRANAKFGSAIAVSGRYLFVSSLEFNLGSGLVEVFARTAGTDSFVLIGTLRRPTAAMNDMFGCGLAVQDTQLLVGSCGYDASDTDAGHVFAFSFSTSANAITFAPNTALENALTPPNLEANDVFGRAILTTQNHIYVAVPGRARNGVAGAGGIYGYSAGGAFQSFYQGEVSESCAFGGSPCDRRGSSVGRSLAYWRGWLLFGKPTEHNGAVGWRWIGEP